MVSVVEARRVLHGHRGQRAAVRHHGLLRLPPFERAPPGAPERDAACGAFIATGKGSGHPAALNFGG